MQEYQVQANKWRGTELDQGAQGYRKTKKRMEGERDTRKLRGSIEVSKERWGSSG